MTRTVKMLGLTLIVLLSACEPKEPAGQVIATVAGREITASELQQEMASSAAGGLSRDQALDALISRKILTDAATEAKIDKLPSTLLMQARARDLVLISELNRRIHDSAPQPDDAEVKDFVADHPASYAKRRVFILDQFVVTDPTRTQQLIRQLLPLKTLDEVRVLLDNLAISYAQTVGTVDALTIDPDQAEKIAALPPGEVIVSPSSQGLRISRIRETVTLPLPERDALRIARQTIWEKRAGTITNAKINQLIAAGKKEVRYNPAYQPKRQ
ncbi:hypothetical protein H7F50_11825 [Novosphingobium flavum]|uniref:peptidyl-prolyl cis-trans isomerase n=1 Tax=Novosphingobium aerophilum TaxID=2839843 RepID=UPI001639916A|nr:peptidyl-prolyl cis-trans isomerase [Novosphingobium aerophilum]MBC2662445.1 hypothetical protein [Novosphingobium aerophilum]